MSDPLYGLKPYASPPRSLVNVALASATPMHIAPPWFCLLLSMRISHVTTPRSGETGRPSAAQYVISCRAEMERELLEQRRSAGLNFVNEAPASCCVCCEGVSPRVENSAEEGCPEEGCPEEGSSSQAAGCDMSSSVGMSSAVHRRAKPEISIV